MVEKQREVLLSVKDLHVWFELRRFGFSHAGYVKAVDGVTFDRYYGDTIAIVGESGCGKSTLMRTILGLNKPIKGNVISEGKDVAHLTGRDLHWYRSKVGYVQQDPFGALAPFMNIQRILEEPLIIHGIKDPAERERRVRKVMAISTLAPKSVRPPRYCSRLLRRPSD